MPNVAPPELQDADPEDNRRDRNPAESVQLFS